VATTTSETMDGSMMDAIWYAMVDGGPVMLEIGEEDLTRGRIILAGDKTT